MSEDIYTPEELLLSGMLCKPERIDRVKAALRPADFTVEEESDIFRALCDLSERQVQITTSTISSQLDAETSDHLMMFGDSAESMDDITWRAILDTVVGHVAKRESSVSLASLEEKIRQNGTSPDSVMSELSRIHDDMATRIEGAADKPARSYNALMKSTLERIKNRSESDEGMSGITTGFRDLDTLTNGLKPGNLVIVGARPSMGKTAFSMNLVESAANAGGRVLVFSVEMPANDLIQRSLASMGSIDMGHLERGELSELERARLEHVTPIMRDLDIEIDERADLTISQLEAAAIQAHRVKPLSLIMLDYLQLMNFSDIDADNQTGRVGEASRRLKKLAKRLEVPIVVLSQLNRSLEKRPDKRPVNSDLRDSGNIEQDADLILFLYRDEVYNEDSMDKGYGEAIIGKHRNGPLGTVRLKFRGQYCRFENLSQDGPQ